MVNSYTITQKTCFAVIVFHKILLSYIVFCIFYNLNMYPEIVYIYILYYIDSIVKEFMYLFMHFL